MIDKTTTLIILDVISGFRDWKIIVNILGLFSREGGWFHCGRRRWNGNDACQRSLRSSDGRILAHRRQKQGLRVFTTIVYLSIVPAEVGGTRKDSIATGTVGIGALTGGVGWLGFRHADSVRSVMVVVGVVVVVAVVVVGGATFVRIKKQK